MNNAESPPYSTATLDRLLGLYTECVAADLPEGATQLTLNCDFIIGSVTPRPGKKSAFNYLDFFSLRNPGFAANITAANQEPWSNPTNIELDTPGTYASVALNTPVVAVDGIGDFDQGTGATGTVNMSGPISSGSLTPASTPEFAIMGQANKSGLTFTPDAGWTTLGGQSYQQIVNAIIAGSGALSGGGGTDDWVAALMLFKQIGASAPTILQTHTINSGAWVAGANSGSFTNPITAGSTILVILEANSTLAGGPGLTVSDGHNTYNLVANVLFGGSAEPAYQAYVAQNVAAGSYSITGTTTATVFGAALIAYEIQGGVTGVPSLGISEFLEALNYGFAIPNTVGILGFQVLVSGHQTSLSPDAVLTVSLLNPAPLSPTFTIQLPSSDGTITVATPVTNWDLALTPALFNDPSFGVKIQALAPGGEPVTFDVYGVQVKVFLTPNPPPSFNYLKSFEQPAGEVHNLALDNTGIMWSEDAINNPGMLEEVYSAIEPNTFAQSVTQSGREFIALSDLNVGTDIPYTYNGVNFDRLSQVGPGAPPTCSSSANGSAITSITQNPAIPLLTGAHDWTNVSDSPGDHGTFGTPSTPGNVMALVFRSATPVPSYITPGTNIFLSGFPTINGNRVNNDPAGALAPKFYTVTSIGQAIPGQDSYNAIVFTVAFTTFYNQKTTAGSTIQSTLATMTTPAQIPNLEVGSQFQITGATPSGYDNTWTVLQTPNASQLQITSTSLLNNVATYAFNIVSGVAPVAGQFITVSQTLNGNGVFNVARAVIASVGGTSFSINLVGPNVSAAAENGAGIIFGTVFVFDAFAIFGNTSVGGSVVTAGIIGAGIRKVCVSFQTRNGYVTQPSPIATFDVTVGASAIAVANIPTGPSDVIARIISFTGGNGGNFFYIPVPVTVLDPSTGQNVVNTATVVNDNTTTNATFSFSDLVLLNATSIDTQGNNLFETAEVGSMLGLVRYADGIVVIGENNKLTNLLNWSFDGGTGVVQGNAGGAGGAGSVNATYPLGWTVDPVNGTGVSVITSPIFGTAFSITNASGSTQTLWGMITQGAFQDEFEVPIIEPSTTYSVRVTAAVGAVVASGALVVDLFSPSLGKVLGDYTIPLSSLTTVMSINVGEILNATLAPVPKDLLIRIYATNILNGTQIIVDRIEPFPTEEPVLETQVTISYPQNFEAFDQIEGVIDTASENPQPVRCGFVLFDTLYLVKTKSMVSTENNTDLPPANWTVRTVSDKVGTPSIYGVDSGEDWAVVAGEAGVFYFSGGQPSPLTREIQTLWNMINWKYGNTLWCKNDVVNQRIMVGVPMRTKIPNPNGNGTLIQNPFIPAGAIPDAPNPTTPNVIIELNYKQVDTGAELEERKEVRVSSYTGKLMAIDAGRKWCIWSIKAPCAAFLTQDDTTAPLFVGNSDQTGKIYELVDGYLQDDGAAVLQLWTSYGFVSTDQEAQMQGVGSVRKIYEFCQLLFGQDSIGSLNIRVFPNTLTTPYAHDLLPPIVLPGSDNGETEVPLNENGQQLFMQFSTNAVGEGFTLSRIRVMMTADPWAPVRGR